MHRAIGWLKHLTFERSGSSKPLRNGNGKITLLSVETPDAERERLEEAARAAGWDVILSRNCEDALRLLASRPFAIILCDRESAGTNWRAQLEQLAAAAPSSCILLSSSVNDEYLWQEVVHHGGFDVITKPFQQESLTRRVNDAWLFWTAGLARHPLRR